jgi:hypothetical protein
MEPFKNPAGKLPCNCFYGINTIALIHLDGSLATSMASPQSSNENLCEIRFSTSMTPLDSNSWAMIQVWIEEKLPRISRSLLQISKGLITEFCSGGTIP